MINKLQAIAHGWHKRYSSQGKTKQSFIKLSHKSKKDKAKQKIEKQKNENHQPLFSQNLKQQKKNPNSSQINFQLHKITKKLSSFIQKMQETLKRILYQKDVKWYLNYANTSQTQVMDNVSNSLIKFKQLLYRLKQVQNRDSSTIDTTNGRSGPSSETLLESMNSKQNNQINFSNHRKSFEKQKFNLDVLQLLLQYFQDHMIPESHWSLKKQNNSSQKVDFFSKFFGKFKFNCYSAKNRGSFEEQQQNNLSSSQQLQQKLQLQSQVSSICEQINKQQAHQQQKKKIKWSFNLFKHNHNQNKVNKEVQNKIKEQMVPKNMTDLLPPQNMLSSITKPLDVNLSQNQIQQLPMMKPVQQTLNAILKIEELKSLDQMNSIQKIAYLFDLQSKIFVSSQLIISAAYFQDDITTLPKSKYQHVWKFINFNDDGDQKKINDSYKMMKMLMVITNASVIRQLEINSQENSWFKKIIFGLSFPRYFFQFSKARLQNHKFLRKPNVKTTKSIWNLPENGYIKQLKKPFVFDSIKCNIEFYIPRVKSTNLRHFKERKYDDKLNIFTPNQNSIRIRLLNHKELTLDYRRNENVYETVIIHYHGGGFIALSSCTFQTYTRKWANTLKVPVFSVDYGKPPEFRFPYPVLDCLQAYKFITTQIHKFMNIKPKKVIIAGDSAGGNLACSVTGLTLKLDLKIPDGLLLVYPAVDTRNQFSPSRINSFNDVILYPTLLMLCMQEYLGDDASQNQFNPLASPILLTQDYVSEKSEKDSRWPLKWPRSIIMVGKKDPLFDDSLRLCQRLASSNIQFHCQLYKNFTHAFLSIDKMVPQCFQTIKDSIKFFQKLISGQPIGKKKLI